MIKKGEGKWSVDSSYLSLWAEMVTEQRTVLQEMSFFFSSGTDTQNWSINSLTPSALHDAMMWNTNNKNHKTQRSCGFSIPETCSGLGWMEYRAIWSGDWPPRPEQGGLIWLIFKVPSKPSHSMIWYIYIYFFWFYEYCKCSF